MAHAQGTLSSWPMPEVCLSASEPGRKTQAAALRLYSGKKAGWPTQKCSRTAGVLRDGHCGPGDLLKPGAANQLWDCRAESSASCGLTFLSVGQGRGPDTTALLFPLYIWIYDANAQRKERKQRKKNPGVLIYLNHMSSALDVI